ncbi:MAG: flagellar biosynthetic protein FliR [Velocimicrobium sp.]
MSFTIENLEFYLMIIVRMSAFIFSAPFFNLTNVPRKVKVGIAVFLGLMMANMVEYTPLVYSGTIGFGILVIKEAIVGLLIGYSANVCSYIVNFSGQLIDMEIGLSMVNVLDLVSKIQTTISGNLYSYLVMFLLMATNMHYYILSALFDSFTLIPIGKAVIKPSMYEIMVRYIVDYFVIGFRIILPVFATTLLINIILGIMAKVAPQMNMFVIGMQLKIIIGFVVLLLIIELVPQVSDFIFTEMKMMMNLIMRAMAPT